MLDTMTLDMECFREELSPVQIATYAKAEREHNEIRDRLKKSNSENIFSGNIFSAYQLTGIVTGLENYSKPVAAIKTANRKIVSNLRLSNQQRRNAAVDLDDDELESMPLAKRKMILKENSSPKRRDEGKQQKTYQKQGRNSFTSVPIAVGKPSEGNSIGGLAIGRGFIGAPKNTSNRKDYVDLTKDDGRIPADSREVNFNKLQGKTYPSLVVVVRPSLKVRETAVLDRGSLDSKVKTVLMYTPAKFTEWLIQQGLVRSEQNCHLHVNHALKLGMYSDVSKFQFSGGYVWISECCTNKFVSVFNGSLFESAGHPPNILLKLIYHWACQTNVQNVIQWVKVDNLYVKGFFSWLRSVCTVGLYNHFNLLGGPSKRIEVGVISLGTSTADGQQRQVKVEVLGVYDPVNKFIRLRAVEPLPHNDKSYKKRFLKILEPLVDWVHEDSIILTDLTVDKATLMNYGFKNVIQYNSNDQTRGSNTNAVIMDYLRRIVPRMFQNTLSLLSRPIIQQFLDELVWREWYGTSPGMAFDNIVSHIAEQTRLNARESLVTRLASVSANPFKDWSHLSTKGPVSASDILPSKSPTGSKRKRIQSPTPQIASKKASPALQKQVARLPVQKKPEPVTDYVSLESFYYGIYNPYSTDPSDSCVAVAFEVRCPECDESFVTNLEFQDHLFSHFSFHGVTLLSQYQCRYCLDKYVTQELLTKHIMSVHPIETKVANGFCDLICEFRYNTLLALGAHMSKHMSSELPFKCGGCQFLASSKRLTINHFYDEHGHSAMLMCPLCLKIFVCANRQGKALEDNIMAFCDHLRLHTNKVLNKECKRCSMTFVNKGLLKLHQLFDHNSRFNIQDVLKPISKTNTLIARPKNKPSSSSMNAIFKIIAPMDHVSLDIPNGKVCLECGLDFDEENHIVGLVQCQKCSFQTCCLPACVEHNLSCTIPMEQFAVSPLNMEYFCVCGYSSSEGNALARHLASCERRSAYSSAETAQENTVQRNMLDMLGLVRRDEDDDDVVEISSNVDDQAEAVPQETDVEENIVNLEQDEEESVANVPEENIQMDQQGEKPLATEEEIVDEVQGIDVRIDETIADGGDVQYESTVIPQQEQIPQYQTQPAVQSHDQFNTQLSLDDLGPQSVLPQQEQDRTPQLREEYQSLATPQVQGEYEQHQYEPL